MSGNIDMNLNKITDVGEPVNVQDVVTKNYLDTSEGIQKCWVAYGNQFLPLDNTIMGLLALPTGKHISNAKIMICTIWIERETNTYFDADCGDFKSVWTPFHG